MYNNLITVGGLGRYVTDENAQGFTHPVNQRVAQRIVREVKSVENNVSEILEASKVYYKTVKDKSTRQRWGTVVKQQQQNKRSRIMRKKIDRRAKA